MPPNDPAAVPASAAADRPAPAAARAAWIDVFRGVAILAVCLIHILPRFLTLHAAGSPGWWAVFIVHRLMFFAVPGFLLLSAMVNTASLLRRPPGLDGLGGYFKGRLGTVLWPYLAWSGIYIAYQALGTRGYDFGRRLLDDLRWGTAWPHLYFMVVLIQLLIALPLLAAILRRTRAPRPFWAAALTALGLAAAVYFANKYLLPVRLPRPGSALIWYALPVTLGVWLGGEGEGARERLRRGVPYAVAAWALSTVAYVYMAAAVKLRLPAADTMRYQFAEWGYAATATLALLGLAARLSDAPAPPARRITDIMARLGLQAFPVYLAHPLVLVFLDRYRSRLLSLGEVSALLLIVAAAVGLPLLLGAISDALRLSPILFGRGNGGGGDAKKKKPAADPTKPARGNTV